MWSTSNFYVDVFTTSAAAAAVVAVVASDAELAY